LPESITDWMKASLPDGEPVPGVKADAASITGVRLSNVNFSGKGGCVGYAIATNLKRSATGNTFLWEGACGRALLVTRKSMNR